MTDGPPAPFAADEARVYWRYISSSIDRLVTLAMEAPAEVISWEPPAAGANSILGLTRHTLANAEENILGLVLGHPVNRLREDEFAAKGSVEAVATAWNTLREELDRDLVAVTEREVSGTVRHPRRGELARREVLLVVARHAAEHLGQAELTRDLAHAAPGRS
jgi:HAMP domain-containing protein